MNLNQNLMVKDSFIGPPLPNNNNLLFKSNKELVLNKIKIIARKEDKYINLNQLCKAGKREFREYKRLEKTKAYLQVLSLSVGIPTDELIKYTSGSNNERANWGHPQVGINVAQWISAEFDVQVSSWVYELLLFGKVKLGKEKTPEELENKLEELISVNITEYNDDDVLYIAKFLPTEEYEEEDERKDREYYKYGVSSGIDKRSKQHNGDNKYKSNYGFIFFILLDIII
jgi:hypothetical protein